MTMLLLFTMEATCLVCPMGFKKRAFHIQGMMLQLYDFQKLEKLFRPVNLPQTVGSKVIAIVCKEL